MQVECKYKYLSTHQNKAIFPFRIPFSYTISMFHKQGKTFFPLSVSRTLRTFLFARWGELGMVDFLEGGGVGGRGRGRGQRKKKN